MLDLSADLASVPVSMGPEPILYARAVPLRGDEDEDNMPVEQEESDGEDHEAEEAAGYKPKTVAQARYRQMVFEGFCDAPIDGPEEQLSEWNTFNRDVEWMLVSFI